MDWIIKRIESCNKKIAILQDIVKSYENILGKEKAKKDEEIHQGIQKKTKASELINLFPELFDRSRMQEVNMIKMVVTVMILNLGFGVYETGIILMVHHSTIINRRRVYYNLIDTKDTGIMRAIEIVENRINGIPSDYPFYEAFAKFIKNKYRKSKNTRYIDIAIVTFLKQKIYFNERIGSFFGKSDAWIRTIMYSRKELNYNEQYLNVEKMINLDFENFKKYENE